jgi:hypothetical protein
MRNKSAQKFTSTSNNKATYVQIGNDDSVKQLGVIFISTRITTCFITI